MLSHFAELSGSFEAVDASVEDVVVGTNKKCALYIGTGGDLVVVGKNDDTVETTFVGLQAGYHLLDIKKIVSAGTDASDIVILR